MKKRILTLIGVCAVLLAVGTATKIKAGTSDNVRGWIWSAAEDAGIAGVMGSVDGNENGVGWISMNSANCDTNGNGQIDAGDTPAAGCPTTIGTIVANYGVTIPGAAGGAVTGYAYSENIGAIDFNPATHCVVAPAVPGAGQYQSASCTIPPGGSTGGVSRSGNNLTGWARIVEIAEASATGNSGGWTGWIHMNGTGYGVSIDGTGKLLGYGSAGADELGYVNFASDSAMIPPPPTVTLNASPLTINVDNPLPQNTNLTWSTTNATGCTASTSPDSALWTGAKGTASSGSGDSVQIDATHLTETFTLTCTGPGGSSSSSVTVTTGCNKRACSGETCAPTFIITGTADNSTCLAQSTCATDNDCVARSSGKWIEIAP